MEQLFQDLHRILTIEETLPQLEQEHAALKEAAAEAEARAAVAKYDLDALENPGFFTQLLGRVEDKKETARIAYRSAAAARDRAKQELAARDQQLQELKAEYTTLLPVRDRFDREAKQLDPQLVTSYICRLGSGAAHKVILHLETARSWMRYDPSRKDITEGNRRMEFLALAAEQAQIVARCVDLLPEAKRPASWGMTTYFQHPEDYVTGAANAYKQLDLLDLAQRHAKAVRDEMKAML